MQNINKILWAIAIVMIFINSIYFSIKLKFPQLKIRTIIKTIFIKEQTENISAKDSLIISLASKIGAGSLAGISFAIYYGGIGTVFWMWIASFFVSINCYLENILSTIFKEKDGIYYKGGPAYYIKNGLNKKKLSIIYSILAICAYILGFLAIQNNTITTLMREMFNINKYVIALLVTIFSAFIIVKGIKTISNICNKIVPCMTIIYLLLGVIVIFTNINKIPIILFDIVKSAFTPSALNGGLIYTFIIGMQKGIFANEAGVETSAISSGANSNKDYKKQGYMGIIETYFISILITTVTSFIVILSNYNHFKLVNVNGIEITKLAFLDHFGHFGEIILLIILILFAFSTIITGYYYGESNLKILTKKSSMIKLLKLITIISIFMGGILSSLFVWEIVDLFIALLAIINIYAIYKLKNVIFNKLKHK